MASKESVNENRKNLNYDELDLYSKLDVKLKARNKITHRKEIDLPCAHIEDTDLSVLLNDNNVPSVRLNKRLQDNVQSVGLLMDSIHKLKLNSEMEMDFTIDEETDENDEVSQTIAQLRQQSEKLFKKIIHTQVAFNECLSLADNSENKEHKNNHLKLIEKTCKFDRGVESVIGCKKDTLKNHIDKNLQIENVEEFKNAYNELAQGILTTTYDAAVKTYKNHEHLLAIKQYNKSTKKLPVEELVVGKLDPYSKQAIINPISNKVCKHIYDQESVNQMFQNKLFVSCPYIGCTNKQFTKTDLDISTNSN